MFLRCLFCCSDISVPESLPCSINYVIILSSSFLISSFFVFFLRDAIAVSFWSQHLHIGILIFVCLSKTSNLPKRKGTWMTHFQRYCLVYSFCLYIYIYTYTYICIYIYTHTPWQTIKFFVRIFPLKAVTFSIAVHKSRQFVCPSIHPLIQDELYNLC